MQRRTKGHFKKAGAATALACAVALPALAQFSTNAPPDPGAPLANGARSAIEKPENVQPQTWNLHFQNTDIVQGDFGFPAKYSGPNSLNSHGEAQETVTADLFAGVRLWPGAEAHLDGLMWQGFGFSQTFGIEAFPNGDAYKAGTEAPNFTFARLFIRQTIGLGGEQEDAPDDQLTLAGVRIFDFSLAGVVGHFGGGGALPAGLGTHQLRAAEDLACG